MTQTNNQAKESAVDLRAQIRAQADGLTIKGRRVTEATLAAMVKTRFGVEGGIDKVKSVDDLRAILNGLIKARNEQDLRDKITRAVAENNDEIALREYLEINCGGRGLGELSLDELIVAQDRFVGVTAGS